MRLIDVVRAPWAITPEMFLEVQSIYSTHMRGEKIDLAGVEARLGAPLANVRQDLQVVDGVAVIALDGVLAKRANLMMRVSGGTSTQIAAAQLRAALEDPRIGSILLHIDSPGGTVDGTQDLAAAVREARGRKPVVAVADGMMASAAYWIGSAASKIFMTNDTTYVGSIGVVAQHQDWSGYESKMGVKTTEITAGKYKRMASEYAPLTQEGRDMIQEQVDAIYSVFVDQVAANRGVSVDKVLSDMADGRLFIGQQAIAAGLVDGVSTVDALISRMAAGEFSSADQAAHAGVVVAADLDQPQAEEIGMDKLTIEKVKADHPEVATALAEEGKAAGREEGAKAERERIKSVLALPAKGHEALREQLAFDGKTTRADAALQILEASEAKREQRAKDLDQDGAEARVSAAAPKTDNPPESAHSLAARARAYQEEQAKVGNKVSAAAAVAHVSKEA